MDNKNIFDTKINLEITLSELEEKLENIAFKIKTNLK